MIKNMKILKERAYDYSRNPHAADERNYLYYKAILDNPPMYSHNLRRAYIDKFIFDNYTVQIGPEDLIAGTLTESYEITPEKQEVFDRGMLVERTAGAQGGFSVGGTYHRVIDYEKLLSKGIEGIIEEIDAKLVALSYDAPETSGKRAFYQSCKVSLQAVCDFADRYRDKLKEMSGAEKDSARAAELKVMSENFAVVPRKPAKHFYEALQSMWFVQFCLKLLEDVTLTGRLDNYMLPYYEKDIRDGCITKDFAFELICQLFVKHNEIYGTWPASVMVGGVDRAGNAVLNDLTYMCVDAIRATGLINPSVAVCYTDDTPDDLLDKCVDTVAEGYTRPSIFNDKVIRRGLMEAGVAEEDARYYVHSTCVEITPIGCSNIMVATPYININKAFEYIFGGKKAIFGEPCRVNRDIDFNLSDLKTFDEFYSLAKDVVSAIIDSYLTEVCDGMYQTAVYKSCPLSSAFLNDCLEKGKNAAAGGAKYNFVYPCFPGFINFIDILGAVKKAVYTEKIISLEELAKLLASDYENGEAVRQYLLNRCPKFGNGDDEIDVFGVEMYEFLKNELKKYKTCIGGSFHSSYFAWVMHGILGSAAAATPDGRKQAEALSECLGSVQGMDKNGPTGVLNSIKKIDQKSGIGGIATNFRFSKSFIGSAEGHSAVKNFIKTFFKSGCFEIQFNVVDQKDLINAQKEPEKYRTLMVRVAGYSDYFVNLAPVIQNEIIKRSEHGEI